MKPYRKIRTTHWRCRCQRCGHKWDACVSKIPEKCQHCRARDWSSPVARPAGRPRKVVS